MRGPAGRPQAAASWATAPRIPLLQGRARPLAEPACVLGKPDGYYLIGEKGGDEWCLVYLYAHADFEGVRHLAFGMQDGGGLLPVWDLRHDSVLLPATIHLHGSAPSTLADLKGRFAA